MKHEFKVGAKVVCKIQHHSTHVSWNSAMNEIIGVTGIVVSTGQTFYNKRIVRVDFGGLYKTLIWTMDPKWLERTGQQHKFKAGDKVICKESHTGSQSPKWHDCMDAFVGAHGTVFDYVSVFGDEYVRVTFSPRLSKTDWCFLEDWLVPAVPAETQDNTQDKMTTREFKLGDKAVCREKHTGCDSPNWVTDMDRIVGVVGTVVGLGSYIRVKYGNGYDVEWSFRPEWLEPALTSTQDKMTTLSSQEALITVKALKVYAHMSDKVAYYRVNLGEKTNAYFNDTPIEYVLKAPKKEETPEPVPKFQKGDIVVCKTKPRAASPSWGRDVLLDVPGRVVGPCPNGVTVEFLGDRVVYDFRDEWLVHEEPDIAKTMQDVFSRKK